MPTNWDLVHNPIVSKGGPGSGPPAGHPFEGNQWVPAGSTTGQTMDQQLASDQAKLAAAKAKNKDSIFSLNL